MNGLTAVEHRAIAKARRAMAETLQGEVPPEQLLPLLVSATVAAFIDIVTAAGETPEIVSYINQHLEAAGLRLTSIRR